MIKNLQSLRFIFALMIFLHHSAVPLGAFGTFPVSFFLILSGFVMEKGYRERIDGISYLQFAKSRLLRVYPTHLLCLAVALCVSLFLLTPIKWEGIIANMLLLQSWTPDKEIYFSGNSVSWFLSVILFCYLVFPVMSKLVRRYRHLSLVAILTLYFILVFLTPEERWHDVLYVNPLCRVVDFFIGMWLCEMLVNSRNVYEKKLNKGTWGGQFLGLISLFVSLSAIYFSLSVPKWINFSVMWWLPSVFIIYVCYILRDNDDLISKVLRHKIPVALGTLSFAFYMIHIQVLRINNYLMEQIPINYIVDGLIVLTVTVGIAYVMTFYYEPLFSRKKNEKK